MKISVIVPVHNEEENIEEIVEKIENTLCANYELVIVNDHCQDKTPNIIKQLAEKYGNIRMVDNKDEKGFANALKTGLFSANTEVVLPVMGDLCDDLTIIDEMLMQIESGFDVVCGSRYIPGGARLGGSKLKAFLSRYAGISLYYLMGIPTHDIANAFKMYKKEVLAGMKLRSKGFEISMEIPLKAYYSGYKITEVPTVWRERTRGKSNFKILKLLPGYLKLYAWAIYKRMGG